MRRRLVVIGVIVLAAGLVQTAKQGAYAIIDGEGGKATTFNTGWPVVGGGTAVILSNREIWDLTLSGWKDTGISSPIPVTDVAVVLSADRLVGKDGRGWTFAKGQWTRHFIPSRE